MKRQILSAILLFFMAVAAQAQELTVHGTVVSAADKEPLIGASVVSDATKKGVSTDIDGNFILTVPSGSKVTVSYVGFEPKTLPAAPQMT